MPSTLLSNKQSILLLIIAVLSSYYHAIFAPILSVDDSGMYNYLLNMSSVDLQKLFFPGGTGSYYRPILLLSFLMDKYVWGLEESFMHLENILFHTMNTLLVFLLARKAYLFHTFSRQNENIVPFLSALLFAVHPINTESVIWISGRTDLLAGFFLLSATFMVCVEKQTLGNTSSAAICLLLACLTKETAIFFLPALMVAPLYFSYGSLPLRSIFSTRSYYLHCAFIALAGACYFMVRNLAFRQGDTGVGAVLTHVDPRGFSDILPSVVLILKTIGFYIKKIIIPFPLNFAIIQVSDWYAILGILICIWCVILIFNRKVCASFFFLASFFVGTSALIIPFLKMTWTPFGERYLYIPSSFFLIGFTFTMASHLQRYKVPPRIVAISITFLLVVAVYGTISRTIIWRDNLTLFQDTMQKTPGFAPVMNEVANALASQGRTSEAIAIYKSFSSAGKLVNFQLGEANKALALAYEQKFDEARQSLDKLLRNPGTHEVYILNQMLEVDKLQLFQGVKRSPHDIKRILVTLHRLIHLTHDPFYYYRLGIVQLEQHDTKAAKASFTQAWQLSPESSHYHEAARKLAHSL